MKIINILMYFCIDMYVKNITFKPLLLNKKFNKVNRKRLYLEIGERLKRLRKFRDLTLEDVANHANLTKGFISQLERDLASPSIHNLKQILDVYGETLASFFKDEAAETKQIFKKSDRIVLKNRINFKKEKLAPKLKYLEMEPEIVEIAGRKTYESTVNDTELFGFVVEGKIQLKTKQENEILENGDCFYLFLNEKLQMDNLLETCSQVLLVSY
jgi:transcriptional regulator with XRE-family HTH domain